MRIQSLDLARGFTVLMIAPIHACMLYSYPSIQHTLLGNIFQFIAEGPGAQLFMTLMGISFTFSKHSFKSISRKAFLILFAGYALNVFKFIIPIWLGIMPQKFKELLPVGSLHIFLLGDILQFAAFALLIIFCIDRLSKYAWMLAIIVCFISPLLWDMHQDNFLIDNILQLSGGQPPQVYFPLFPWLVYPLTGLTIGYYLQQDQQTLYKSLLIIGTLLLLTGYVFDDGKTISFYRTYPAATLLHTGIVLLTIYLWDILNRYVSPNIFFRLLTYMSWNITKVYIVQWILICWLLPVIGYQKLGMVSSIFVMVFISCCTIFITASINFLKNAK